MIEERGEENVTRTTVGVDSLGLEMMMGLLLALDSTTTSSPLGSVTCPVPIPGVPHLSILPLPR